MRRWWRARLGSWWWTATVIVMPVIGLTGLAVWVLLTVLHPDSQQRLEVIKTGLTVGAGTGGVVALVLNGRRQWSNDHDATARRITELYSKSVDQLGSDKAAVRLGGLYALERLANSNRTQQETIGNVICAYLRMSHIQPGDLPDDPTPEQRDRHDQFMQEREIRQTALEILARHNNKQHLSEHWPALRIRIERADLAGMDLSQMDLSGAILTRADLTGAKLVNADLTGAYLVQANLTGATLAGADLTVANLLHADLVNAFLPGADLSGAILTHVDLSGGTLAATNLAGANLVGGNLTDAFLSDADLTGANLTDADLTGANLTRADLTGADITNANFTNVDLSRTIGLPRHAPAD